MATPSRDIEILVEQHDPITKRFFTGPNALYRGEADDVLGYDFRGYTLRERALLAALCSMDSGWRCNRRRIDNLAPELKSDAVNTVLLGLRLKGHLRIVKTNGEHGKFFYVWSVSLRAVPEWAAAEAAGRTRRRVAAGAAAQAPDAAAPVCVSAGQSMGGKSGHGDAPPPSADPGDVSAGQSMGRSTRHGSSTRGSSMAGSSGCSKKYQEEEQPPEKEHPHHQRAGAADADSPPPADPGPVVVDKAAPRFDDRTRAVLADAVDRAVALKPRWRPDEVRAAMLTEIDRGTDPALVAAAVVRLAADPESNHPNRLAAPGGWWNTPTPAVPVRVVGPDRERCRTHPGELSGHCGGCRADQVAAVADAARERAAAGPPVAAAAPSEAVEAEKARARARIAAATRRAGRGQGLTDRLARARAREHQTT